MQYCVDLVFKINIVGSNVLRYFEDRACPGRLGFLLDKPVVNTFPELNSTMRYDYIVYLYEISVVYIFIDV